MAYDVKSVNTTLCYLRRGEDYLMLKTGASSPLSPSVG